MNIEKSVHEVNRRGIWWRNGYFSYKDDDRVERFYLAQIDALTGEIVWQDESDWTQERDCRLIATDRFRTQVEIADFGELRPEGWQKRELKEIPNLTPRHWATHPDHSLYRPRN